MHATILLIDDNLEIRENAAELLVLAGYTIFVAQNGKEGLELARAQKPDLILCDIVMPVLDGYGVLRALQNVPELSRIPFIFITAKGEKADLRMGMDLGADDYLIKPFSGDEILSVISTRLKKSNSIKKIIESNLNGHHEYSLLEKQNGIKALSENRTIKRLRKKDLLYMTNDVPIYLYLIISGKIKIFKSNEQGKEYILDIYKEGDYFGYSALMENTTYCESAIALEDSEIALVPKEEFLNQLNSNAEVALEFAKLLADNFSKASEKLLKLAYDSARKRVAEAIIFVSKKYKEVGNDELSFNLLRENISALSGISPESVSRNLTDFKEEGLIETTNGSIKILNLKRLESVKN